MDTRYCDEFVAQNWSRSREIRLWADIERAWMRQHSMRGWLDIRDVTVPTPREVATREVDTRHEFVAFLEVWSDRFRSDEARRWLHFALTSSDVIDTATAIRLHETSAYLLALVLELQSAIESVVEELRVLQLGRTHGQWASPRPANTPLRALAWMIDRGARRLASAHEELRVADLSGPVGSRDAIDPFKARDTLAHFGLVRGRASTQILPRDGWVHWSQCLLLLVKTCEAVAEHYWILAQSDIGEVEVVSGAGSSAMPHKSGNPHLAENVRGLSRLAVGFAGALTDSIVQRGDRDLGHSSAERVALPDLCHVAATAIKRTIQIVQTYQYAPENIEANLIRGLDAGAHSASTAVSKVLAGHSRQSAITETREELQQ